MLYVGSYDKNVYALDAATGKQRWAFTTGGGVSATSAVAERVVYVGSADGNMDATRNNRHSYPPHPRRSTVAA
ncbi:PQQ-binding-like beta-propeller repeat protein [Embleya sp. NPDC005575]|uniref:outer membrane protein assembly factor BamB family protein n=1 Tax=Embleya sp. NPDC005575 TaxID=3156892 RepID=UPI0033AE6F2C